MAGANTFDPNDPNQQNVTQTVTTPNLDLFNPPADPWQIVGDALARRGRPLSGILGGFMSDYGARKTARKEIPAFMKMLESEGAPLTPAQVQQIQQMNPTTALQELSILQSKALQKKSTAGQEEQKPFWDPSANGGTGGEVWKRPKTDDMTGLLSMGEHARRDAAIKASQAASPYKDFRAGMIAHGVTDPGEIASRYFATMNSNAVSKSVQEAQEKPIGENRKGWYNAKMQQPDPNLNPHDAAVAGYRQADNPQQVQAINDFGNVYSALTDPNIGREIKKVLGTGPLATEWKSNSAVFERDPSVVALRNFNTNMLGLVRAWSKTLRINNNEFDKLTSYFIDLPEPSKMHFTSDTQQQALEKVKRAKALVEKILQRNGVDPSIYKAEGESSVTDDMDEQKAEKLRKLMKGLD